jgi:radical SAM family uncharacterized protein/radical SAM-linked protein
MADGSQSSAPHPYAAFLERVRKPAQYVGGESGEIRKPWDAVDARVCLAFPDVYEVGMSHLGFKILYSILNRDPRLLAERAYAPAHDMEAELRAHGVALRSLESARPLRDFDVVGFSLQFELTYTNVLTMLDLGGVPIVAADRGDSDPLVLAGGPVATHAEPMARFVDAFLIGDGEERASQIALTWARLRKEGASRAERLRALSSIGGVYVPALYETALDPDTGFHVVQKNDRAPFPVVRAFVPNIDDYPFPSDGPVATAETVFDRVSVEIARGCTEGCRFCQAGMIYRPVRERSPSSILETIHRSVDERGYDEVSLTSLSTADYSAVSPLVRKVTDDLEGKHVSVAVSSLRAYGLADDVMDAMSKAHCSGLTFAPEAGTQRMRDVVNKNVTEAQLLETAARVFSRGFNKMKLYFMIGLPTEEDEDVRGIVGTGARAMEVGETHRGRGAAAVTVSVSTHVPKPHTPFQWCAMDDRESIGRKQEILKSEARRARVKLRMHASDGSWLEGVLARGDRTLGVVIEDAWRNGARFDSWEEHLVPHAWTSAFEKHAIDTTKFLGTIPVTARLPWDHIDVGLDEGFLAKEYKKAVKNRLSPPCGKAVGRFVHHTNVADAVADPKKLVCYDCGVACDLGAMKEERLVFLRSLGAHEKPAPKEVVEAKPRTKKERQPPPGPPPVAKLRLAYERLGRVAYASHLDLVRILPRILRAAGLSLHYSNGFRPKAVMTFGPPLPVGVPSLGEYVDVSLCKAPPHDLAALLDRLNAEAVDGLRFFDGRLLEKGEPGLGKAIEALDYVALLDRDDRAALERLGDLRALAADRDRPMVIFRDVQGLKKKVDVAKFLVSVGVGDDRGALARAGIAGELFPIAIRLRVTSDGTARPSEALEALFGTGDIDPRFVRIGSASDPMAAPVPSSEPVLATGV